MLVKFMRIETDAKKIYIDKVHIQFSAVDSFLNPGVFIVIAKLQ